MSGATKAPRSRSAADADDPKGFYLDDGGDLAHVYRQHAAEMVGMLWAFLGNRGAAEDVVQDSFVKLSQKWGELRDPSSAAAYVRSTAFNLARSRLRHQLVVLRHRDAPPGWSASAEEGTILRADQIEVADALRSLPGRQRACVVLRYYADLTDNQIAGDLHISPSSVKTHLARGLASLEARLADRR
jgi:RNA polymerase sigma-70 factor (sigma-E family)